MSRMSRRSFLAASAALAAAPAVAAPGPAPAAADVVIVGAGAAGIAAARRLAAAGRKFVLLEAADHIGGRCITETRTFGVPYDRGAHWIHTPDINPVTKLALRRGRRSLSGAGRARRSGSARRYAREGELEDFLALQVRANRAIADAARKGDVACAQALPNDLGDVAAVGRIRARPVRLRQGIGAGVGGRFRQIRRARAWTRSAGRVWRADRHARRRHTGASCRRRRPRSTPDATVTVETPKGSIAARAAIVTVSTNVIASGAIKFTPELAQAPARSVQQAFARQLRSRRARTRRQSARARERRSRVREGRPMRTLPRSSPTSPARSFA